MDRIPHKFLTEYIVRWLTEYIWTNDKVKYSESQKQKPTKQTKEEKEGQEVTNINININVLKLIYSRCQK